MYGFNNFIYFIFTVNQTKKVGQVEY
jgi:hypothetical protein